MGGIFGVFQRDNSPVSPLMLEAIRCEMAEWGADGGDVWLSGSAGMGQARLNTTPEAGCNRLPYADTAGGLVITATARLDNRDELLAACQIRQSDSPTVSDDELLRHSYLQWGEECVKRVHGDWAFAAYHPLERKLFLARDHYGMTSLYYYADDSIFVFASSRRALLALNLAPITIDELFLAQILVSWKGCHGERTIHTPIKRLPPAHCLVVTPERTDKRLYWRMEDTPELRLPKREDYVAAFRELFDEAVKVRLRGPAANTKGAAGRIAVSLSGGLDSGSVAVTAAQFLRAEGKRLAAFTSVPLSDTGVYIGQHCFADEYPFAQATARQSGNIDLQPVAAASLSPIRAIRAMLPIINEPAHAAGNFYWMLELQAAARDNGCRVLLTGQMGNCGISWRGDAFSQSMHFQLRHFGWKRWPRELLKRYMPSAMLRAYRHARLSKEARWQSTAIHPDFARRLNLHEQLSNAPDSNLAAIRAPLAIRFNNIFPGCSFFGAMSHEIGAAHGLDIRDPTADARLLAFTLSVPDEIFINPQNGLDRWLVREAMHGRLPDQVRLNRKRGRQASDLVLRLRASAGEVDVALDEMAHGPAAAYLDVDYMRQVWRMIRTQDSVEARRKAVTVLTRGIMAGLWVNGFCNAS